MFIDLLLNAMFLKLVKSVSKGKTLFLIVLLIVEYCNNVYTKTADEEIKEIGISTEENIKNFTSHDNTLAPRPQIASSQLSNHHTCKDSNIDNTISCPTDISCSTLGGNCLICEFNCSCIYGNTVNVTCSPKAGVACSGSRSFTRQMVCQYCYQTPNWQHNCSGTANCPSISSPRKMFKANCSVKNDVICLGNRTFFKRIPCNWTSGYQWSTALILSITLGGFGADRFYLGHWQEGIGKLFSFGGLGVWTIIDVILITIRYLGPANESLYI